MTTPDATVADALARIRNRATLVAAARLGLSERRAKLRLPGGDLFIDWRDDDHVAMTGPVEFEFETRLTSLLFEGVDA